MRAAGRVVDNYYLRALAAGTHGHKYGIDFATRARRQLSAVLWTGIGGFLDAEFAGIRSADADRRI